MLIPYGLVRFCDINWMVLQRRYIVFNYHLFEFDDRYASTRFKDLQYRALHIHVLEKVPNV